MAVYRKIHITFWSDAFVSELKDREKLFYLYLLTNERTSQLGVYEITKKQIAFDLGYSIDTVSVLINLFQNSGKIKYNEQTSEVAIKNWNKFNYNPSSKVQVLVNKEVERIKDKTLIEYLYSTDTVSIHNPPITITETVTIAQTETAKNMFDVFWNLYDKKVGDKSKLIARWLKLPELDREKIMQHVPKYKLAQPDKKYRKDPTTYFNNAAWNDEIIGAPISATSSTQAFVSVLTDKDREF